MGDGTCNEAAEGPVALRSRARPPDFGEPVRPPKAALSADIDVKLRDSRSLAEAAEGRFRDDAGKRSFRFLLAYMGVQVLYLLFYFSAAQSDTVNFIPLVSDLIMLGLHCVVAISQLKRCFHSKLAYSWLLAFALTIDSILFALADPVVEGETAETIDELEPILIDLGLPHLQRKTSLPHPYKSNLVFQFHCLYMTLMVLSFRWASLVMPVNMGIYSSIVAVAYYTRYSRYEKEGIDSAIDREEMLVEVLLMWCTLILGLVAKRNLEQAQRPLFFALEVGKDDIVREKVKRCKAEYEASGLQEKVAWVRQQFPSILEEESSNFGVPSEAQPKSVISAPARTSRSVHPGPRKSQGNPVCKNGDCLPSNARVWIENEALPKSLGSVTPGQRVLCYDTLLRGLKYADVLRVECSKASASAEWLEVNLRDGTNLEMTPNHPVQCVSAGAARHIEASQLEAEKDSIMVLKTELVRVTAVERKTQQSDGKSPDWIDIRVQHPDRHTVFVAQGAGLSPCGGMAVGTLGSDQPRSDSEDWTSEIASRRTVSAPELDLAAGNDQEAATHQTSEWSWPENLSNFTSSSGGSAREALSKGGRGMANLIAEATHAMKKIVQLPSSWSHSKDASSSQGPSPGDMSRATSTDGDPASACSDVCGYEAVGSSGASATSGAEKNAGGRRRDRQREKKRMAMELAKAAEQGEPIV